MKGQELRKSGQWSQSKQEMHINYIRRSTGSISGNLYFFQAEEHEHTSENGQHLCQCLHKPLYGDSLIANEIH